MARGTRNNRAAGDRAGTLVSPRAAGTPHWSARQPLLGNRKKLSVQFGAGTVSYETVLSGRKDGQAQLGSSLAGRWLGRSLGAQCF